MYLYSYGKISFQDELSSCHGCECGLGFNVYDLSALGLHCYMKAGGKGLRVQNFSTGSLDLACYRSSS